MEEKKLLRYEDCVEIIDSEIKRQSNKWMLSIISSMDYSDVSQIIRIHIAKKWDQYNQEKSLRPWLYALISNQIKNLIRNVYGSFSRPCLRCAAMENETGCRIYGQQNNSCPLYKNWEANKKFAHDVKLPLSIEHHTQEVHDLPSESLDLETSARNLHAKMEKILKNLEWKTYKLLFIEHKSEEEAAKALGYKISEGGRQPGYRQIKNLRKSIMVKVKKVLYSDNVDIV